MLGVEFSCAHSQRHTYLHTLSLPSSLSPTLPPSLPHQFSVLDDRLNDLEPALREVLNRLLDPRIFSVDR